MGNFYRSKIYQRMSGFSTTIKTIYRNIQKKKFEPEVYVLDKLISLGSICFDIGAGYGRYALIMSRLVGGSGHIYCFEPGDYSYKVISNIVRFHRLKNVSVVKKALSNKEGSATLVLPVKRSGRIGPSLAHLSIGLETNGIFTEVEMTTLDDYCSKINITRLDFIKCDVEGAELLVFEGAKDTIARFKPTILCEIDKRYLNRFDSSPEQIYDYFYQMGYKTFMLKDKKFEEVTCIVNDYNYFFINIKSGGKLGGETSEH